MHIWEYEYDGPFDEPPVYDKKHNFIRLMAAVDRMGEAGRKWATAVLEDLKELDDE